MEQHPPLPRILNTVARFWVSWNGQVLNHRVGAGVRRERWGVKTASSSPHVGCSHPSQMDLFCNAEEEGNFEFCFIATAYNLGEPQEAFLLRLTGRHSTMIGNKNKKQKMKETESRGALRYSAFVFSSFWLSESNTSLLGWLQAFICGPKLWLWGTESQEGQQFS